MAAWRHAAGDAPRLCGRGAFFASHHGSTLMILEHRDVIKARHDGMIERRRKGHNEEEE